MDREDPSGRLSALLEDIRDGQQRLLAAQTETMKLHREHLDLVRAQFERASRLQDRAEGLQQTYSDTLRRARVFIFASVGIIALLLIYLGWLLLRLN